MKKKIISFINLKGGTGKTTISSNIAYLMKKLYGLKILYIDMDKQGNGSKMFSASKEVTISDLFFNEKTIQEIIQKTVCGVDVIAANMDLLVANIEMIKNKKQNNVHTILGKAIQSVRNNYDLIIIDSPPDVNLPILNSLLISDEVVAVATPDGYSLDGLVNMMSQIDSIRKMNARICYKGCVMNKYIKTENTEKCIADLKVVSPVFAQTLRFTRDRVDSANNDKKAIYELSPNCGFAQDLKKFTKELFSI